MKRVVAGIAVICFLAGNMGYAAGESAQGTQHPDPMFLVSPLAGWHENTLTSIVPGPGGMTEVSSSDSGTEYDLFTLFVHPRLVVNNTLFYAPDINDAAITGDFLFVNLYAEAEKKVRWNIGAGYLWHEIDLDGMNIDISMPMVKLGFLAKCPFTGVQLNPYIGYAWEGVETTYGNEYTESVLYGVTAKYYWRMLHVSLKYYLQDDLDTDEKYNVGKARISFFFNEQFGLVARGEYAEHSQTKDKSLLIGPAIIF